MEVFLFGFIVFGLSMAGLALGLVAGRPPLAGGCGSRRACKFCKECPRKRKEAA